jgi:hypothetical protein
MIMKKIFFPAALAAILFASCKKDKDGVVPSPPQGPPPQIATIKQTIHNNLPYDLTKEFVYDMEGRLKEVKYSGAQGQGTNEKYTYTGNAVTYRYFIAGAEAGSASINYTLNSNNLAGISVSPYFNASSLHEYNSNGYLTHTNFLHNGVAVGNAVYHYSSVNELDSMSGFSSGNAKQYVHIYTYETGKRNTIGDENRGIKILGKDQAAPLKKRILYSYQLPGYTGIRMKFHEIDYTYEYDNEGRIKKHTAVYTPYNYSGSAGQSYTSEVMEYTYKQ